MLRLDIMYVDNTYSDGVVNQICTSLCRFKINSSDTRGMFDYFSLIVYSLLLPFAFDGVVVCGI